MNSALVVTVMTWAWLVAAAGVLSSINYYLLTEGIDDTDRPADAMAAFAAASAIGVAVLALRALGRPEVALWAWRLAPVGILPALIYGNKAIRTYNTPFWKAVPISLVALLVVTTGGFLVQDLAPSNAVVKGPATTPAHVTHTTWIVDGVQLWHGTALVLLALGTLLFLWLFVRMVERGITPQLDSHWGGIGGGMGGWRISASLTYLIIAAAFGVLFGLFVLQLEKKPAVATATKASAAATQK